MSSSIRLRHLRHLSTTAAAADTTRTAATTTAANGLSISISRAKSRLRSEHDPDKALEIYNSASKNYSSPVFSRYAQDVTVRRLAKSHRFDDIEALIESHKKDPKITEETFVCTLIRSYGQAGMLGHAIKMFEQMDELGTRRSALSFNALLTACNQSKLFDKVPTLFDEIPKKYGISSNKITYGILIRSYCMSGSLDKAIETLKEMEKKKVEITNVTFTTILDALYTKGESKQAEKLWNEMAKRGCELDVAAYNVRLGYAHGGKPEDVKLLLDEMKDAGLKPDAISYNYLMTCYCKCGMMEEAQNVYLDLEANGCRPNAATFRTMIYHLCRIKDFVKGYKVFKDGVKFHKIPDFGTLSLLVEGLVEKKKLKEAKELIRTVKKKFPPNLLNAWLKIERDLGLASTANDAATAAIDEDEDEQASA